MLTIHVEAVDDPRPVLEKIRRFDVLAGLALNPDTPLDAVADHLDLCDLALVMSVNAGFGGQKFNPVALEKLQKLREIKPDHCVLEVDGGVNANTISQCSEAGADLLVVGSAIFRQEDYTEAVGQLHSLLG